MSIYAYISASFLFMAEEYSIVWMEPILFIMFIHPSTDEHLGYFHILTTVDSAAMNTHIFGWTCFWFSEVYTSE